MTARRLAWLAVLPIVAVLATVGGFLLLAAVLLRGALAPDQE